MQVLGQMSAIILDSSTNEVIVMGDFNADFKCRFGEELVYFTADTTLQIYDDILRGYWSDLLPILAKNMVLCRGLIT